MDASKLPITGPCPIDLDAIGFDRTGESAHCTHCEKTVHNLSNLSQTEVRAFLKANAGQKVCVSYRRSSEGVVRFKEGSERRAPAPPPASVVPVSRLRRASSARLPGAVGLAAALAACTPVDNPSAGTPTVEATQPKKVEHTDPPKVETPPPHQVLAGMMAVPDKPAKPELPVDVDGEMVVPEEIVDGEIEVVPDYPSDVEVEGGMDVPPDAPCDPSAKPGAAPTKTHAVNKK